MTKEDALIEYAQFVRQLLWHAEGICGRTVQRQEEDVILEIENPGSIKSQRKIRGYIAFVCDTGRVPTELKKMV